MCEELNPSELGTFDYWENVYTDEINNFEDYGDVGEIWFGKNNAQKVVKYIADDLDLSKDDKIMDLGCGNGWTLIQLSKHRFTSLVGVDYSPKAVELAKVVLKHAEVNDVQLKVSDILSTADSQLSADFKLIHDKGTYDAISLNPEARHEKREMYIRNVYNLLLPHGYLVISSCNWTKEELTDHFKEGFEVIHILETPALKFGGKIGKSVTNIVFRKK